MSRRERSGWLWALAVLGPIALLLSHPAIFVIGGVVIALGPSAWRTGRWDARIAWLMSGLISLFTYAAIFWFFTGPQASAAAPGMKEMWYRSFPPLDSLPGLMRWAVVAHSGDMLAYPCGGERGASSFNLLLCLFGAAALIRDRRLVVLGALIAPLALAIVAAGLRLYPYGGPAPHGSAARIMQYAAPALCLLIGLGASRALAIRVSGEVRWRLVRLALLGLVCVGVVPVVASAIRPYRSSQAEADRRFARQFWPEVAKDAEVADLRRDFRVAEWDSIQLGVAVSLCNEAIYSPARIRPGPELSRVSRATRCDVSWESRQSGTADGLSNGYNRCGDPMYFAVGSRFACPSVSRDAPRNLKFMRFSSSSPTHRAEN